MEDQSPQPPAENFAQELADFALELRELRTACGEPSLRGIAREAGPKVPLTPSVISEILNGKRLPKLDFLLSLVQVLEEHKEGHHSGDPSIERWRTRWMRLARMRGEERRRTTTASSPRSDVYALPPGPDATIPELEAAKVEVQDQRLRIERQEKELSSNVRQFFDARVLIDDEIARLSQLLAQGDEDKRALQQRIEGLEKERAELSSKIVQLRDELSSMRRERLSLTVEESELNDRRADLYFAWARSEELKANGLTRQLADTVRQHAVEVSEREQKLAAADQLIVGLRSSRAL